MPSAEIILGLLLAVAVLTTIARQLGFAYPILLVIGGLVLSFVPGIPVVALPPDLVLILFLPPLLFWESFNLSYRDLRFGIGPVLSLAVGLVLVTIGVVAVVVHSLIPGFTWALAFVLGTIVGPTDEVAVSAISERLPLPARLVALIEDESLLNDGSSLVAYTVAIGAVVTGTFSLVTTGMQVLVAGVGGIAIGLAVGWGVMQLRKRLYDPPVENTLSLLTGFAAYLPATALHLSGVLAVVACGLYLSRRARGVVSPRTRLQAYEMWEIVNFLLNGVLFVLVGLQLHSILGTLARFQPEKLLLYAAIVVVTVIVVRIVWVFLVMYLPSRLFSRPGESRSRISWQVAAIVSWTGMRGAVSLAAALAIPFVINTGATFPDRELIIYLTFAVILSTLVLQGLTLPIFIRRLGILPGRDEQYEETAARLAATQAGLERLNSAAGDGLPRDLIDGVRTQLQDRSRRFLDRKIHAQSPAQRVQTARYRRLLLEVLAAERDAIVDLRDQGIISDDVMRIVERELDLDEVRLEPDAEDLG